MPIFNSVYKSFEQGWQPGANTIAYYKFDGNLNDSSGNGNNLSMASGSFTYSTTSQGGKYVQTNKSAYSTALSPSLGTSITVSYWANSGNVTGSEVVHLDIDNLARCWNMGGNIKFGGWSQQINCGTDIGNWHYYTITRSGNTITGYKDGVSMGTYTGSTSGVNRYRINTVAYTTASYSNYTSEIKMGELIIEDKTRTTDEITAYYNLTKGNYGL